MKPSRRLISTEKIRWLVRDARYGGMREGARAVVYVPFQGVRSDGTGVPQNWGTFIVRTSSANPLAMAEALRQELPRARPEFRVSRVRTQLEINQAQTVRERLLAMLALFFGVVAVVLAGVGLYGVLHYSVLERQREIRNPHGHRRTSRRRRAHRNRRCFLDALSGGGCGLDVRLGARAVYGGVVLRS